MQFLVKESGVFRAVYIVWGVVLLIFLTGTPARGQLYSLIDLDPGSIALPGATFSSIEFIALNNAGQVTGAVESCVPDPARGASCSSLSHAFLYSGGTMIDLGTLGGKQSRARGMNNAGQVVGLSETDVGSQQPQGFLYGTAGMIGLGNSTENAAAINDAGQVVGHLKEIPNQRAGHGFLYSQGVLTDLGEFDPIRINAGGQVIGNSDVAGYSHPVLYSNGTLTDLSTLTIESTLGVPIPGEAIGINNAGQVIANIDTAFGILGIAAPRAYRYNSINGTLEHLGSLGGARSQARAINGIGQVVGSSETDNFVRPIPIHAFLHTDGGGMIDLGTLGAQNSDAHDINNAGQVVGVTTNGRAFVYRNGVQDDLNDLLDSSGRGWTLTEAIAINDNGQIAGYGTRPDGSIHLFLLNPKPEQFSSIISGLTFNRRTQTFNGTVQLTNISSQVITGPVQVKLRNLSVGVTLVNASGIDSSTSSPYLTTGVGVALAPGARISVPVQFSAPTGTSISYTVQAFSRNF